MPAIGAAVGAHRLFDNALQNSQALQEAFDRTQAQMKTSVDNFFAALTSGDWSAFDAGISGIIAKAGEAANALDQLGNSMMSLGVVNAKEGLAYQQAMTRLRAAKKGTEEYKAALDDMRKAVGSMSAATGIVQSDQWKAIQTQVASWTNLQGREIQFDWVLKAQTLDTAENRDALKEQAARDVKTYHEEVARLNKEYYTTTSVGFGEGSDTMQTLRAGKSLEEYNAAMSRLNQTYGEAVVVNTLLNRKNDETLQGLDELTIAYYGNARAIEAYKQQIEKLAKPEGGGSGASRMMSLSQVQAEMSKINAESEVSVEHLQALLKAAQGAASQAVGVSAQAEAETVVMKLQNLLADRVLSLKFRMESIGGTLTNSAQSGTSSAPTAGALLAQAAAGMDATSVNAYVQAQEKMAEAQEKANEAVAAWNDLQKSAMTQGIDSLTGAFERLGGAIGGTTGGIISLVAAMAQEVVAGVTAISSLKAQELEHKAKMNAALQDAAAETIAAHSFIPFVGVAIGVGMVASIVSALQGLPKFAEGGVATRATVGIFGEKGAEAIIPLDRLERMMEGRRNGSGDGSTAGKVEFVIRDRELYGVLKNYETRKSRL